MKAIRHYLTIVLLIISITAIAQRTPNKKALFDYTRLPLRPLNENIKNYQVNVTLQSISASDSRPAITREIENAVTLHGYNKVEEDGDIWFNVTLHPCDAKDPVIEEYKRDEKQGDKVVKITKYFYNVEINYPLAIVVEDKSGSEYHINGIVNNSDDYVYAKTPEFNSKTELTNWWKQNKNKFLQEWKKKQLTENLKHLQNRIENLYAYTPTKVYEQVFTASKRKVDFSDLDKAQELAILAYKSVNVNDGFGDNFNSQIIESISIWNKAIEQLDTKDKKARINAKVGKAIQKNLATAYYWQGNFELAKMHVDKVAELDNSERWSKNFMSKIKDRQARFNGKNNNEPIDELDITEDQDNEEDEED